MSLLRRIGDKLPSRDVDRPVDIDALAGDPGFTDALEDLAGRIGRDRVEVAANARGCLDELSASFDPVAVGAWRRFGTALTRAYDVIADEAALAELRELDRAHSLVWLPSHRSYLDLWVLPAVLAARGFAPAYGLGGANLNFFPFGTLARRTGVIFVRRTVADDAVYKLVLREYVGQLARNRVNLAWAIEGGRTRTGKLRPPRYGLLRYLTDAVEANDGPEVLMVPVSIVYDQLHELASMTAEARGMPKSPEDIRWLVRFARQQSRRLGHVYVDVGEPVRLRERLASYGAEESTSGHTVERIALDVCHRINRATRVTPTALVTLALLSADRALTLDQVISTIEPTARYAAIRRWPVAGGVRLTERNAVERTLAELTRTGIVSAFEGGTDTVWRIAEGQHLIAAFYRNTAIHLLVNRAIGEIALLTAAEGGTDDPRAAYEAALALRELLKFEFFFAAREEFGEEMRAEMSIIDPEWETRNASAGQSGVQARRWLEQARPHVAHLVLRPFLDAYLVVAERLAAHPAADAVDQDAFLGECLSVGQQWTLQRKLASDESVTLELFRTALRLAGHRDLLGPGDADLTARRRAFAAQVRDATRRLSVIADMARGKDGEP
jgi:glycerol-3-phosphate O-acyltransferase